MAPPTLPAPKLTISHSPLTPSSFHPFGTAISKPLPQSLNRTPPPSSLPSLANTNPTTTPDFPVPTLANQSTALKYSPISTFQNNYDQSKSADGGMGKAGEPRMSMFSCFPRQLRRGGRERGRKAKAGGGLFDVGILERHPYTTQTFVPLGVPGPAERRRQGTSSASTVRDDKRQGTSTSTGIKDDDYGTDDNTPPASYLVIVAPSLHGQKVEATVFNPEGRNETVVVRDPPDLRNLKAFVAHGGQAVTYGAGTWHAPMVVVGRHRVDFVVVQFSNGVAEDDCQEVVFGDGLVVDVDVDVDVREKEAYEDECSKL
ncbi:hypothetical protein AJ79_08737 [Helicocarpus griseus UAMH5409]|uniref:Ureidoglycolate hydrolase n=1 Tax=Helicocarpus griseus UAMH5409 TaxID=1447875 RepID=A0A2B7WQR4_9EURO|nr:hypothetical protein AJ79_08737 [Helicocarpus griseus UAMH5409]